MKKILILGALSLFCLGDASAMLAATEQGEQLIMADGTSFQVGRLSL